MKGEKLNGGMKNKAKVIPLNQCPKRWQTGTGHTWVGQNRHKWGTVSFVRVSGQKGTRGKLRPYKVERKVTCLMNFKRN